MIIKAFLDVSYFLITLLFSWVHIPQLPSSITNTVDSIFNYIGIGLRFVLIFFDMDFLFACLPILIILINFEHVYKFLMFILRKVPFLNMG